MTLNKRSSQHKKTISMVQTALIFALAIILSFIENQIPSFVPIAGVKLGLSNIAVMYALFFINAKSAFSIALLKALFVLLTRSPTSAFLSFFGGVTSILIMLMLLFVFKEKVSYLIISVSGSIFHNLGQFVALCIIHQTITLLAYLPILIISGVIAGVCTAFMLKLILPALKKLDLK